MAEFALKSSCIGLLLLLFLYSLFLCQNRIFQVDEAQTLYMAKVVGAGETGEFFTTAALSLLGPLAWIASSDLRSGQVFAVTRLLFVGVFWYNVVLSAYLAGGSLKKVRGLLALLVAASLAPLWDYGFEIRHDNLILAFVLTAYWMVMLRPIGKPSLVFSGAILASMPFVAFKAMVFAGPLIVLLLLIIAGQSREGWRRDWMLLLLGMFASGVAITGLYVFTGLWDVLLAGVTGGLDASVMGRRFGIMDALKRAMVQCPLLAIAAIVLVPFEVVRWFRFPAGFLKALAQWPTLGLFVIGCFALFINPTPFPYNLVNVVPYAMIFVFGRVSARLETRTASVGKVSILIFLVLMVHLVSFKGSVLRHIHWTNHRQRLLMETAESMSAKDHRVYDAVGMILSRKSIDYNWYLHSLNMSAFANGTLRVGEMVKAHPPVVIIPNYRTSWLPEDDQVAMLSHHIPIADDFWVLGAWIESGSGDYEVLVEGRYAVFVEGEVNAEIRMDGLSIESGVVFMEKGLHRLESHDGQALAIVWLGPDLDEIPDLGQKPVTPLFVNWY